ncbi:hypothetical protein VTN49DRAFT_3551 [Thermomyces lanuginosus]|uniref:uncharacterized protein n=1 Tax=Thermomyces lanuginosus TaxID=5541 RepID=UPI0037441A14
MDPHLPPYALPSLVGTAPPNPASRSRAFAFPPSSQPDARLYPGYNGFQRPESNPPRAITPSYGLESKTQPRSMPPNGYPPRVLANKPPTPGLEHAPAYYNREGRVAFLF